MNVLVLSMEYTPEISGGVGTQVQELCRGLAQAGHEVVAIAYTLGAGRIFNDAGAIIHLLPLGERVKGRPSSSIVESIIGSNRALLIRAERLIEEGLRPDICQCSNWLTLDAALALRRQLGCPIVSTIHFLSEPSERWWGQTPDEDVAEQERVLCREADHLICVSRSIRCLLQQTHGVDDSRVSVVYNALDATSFIRPPLPDSERHQLKRKLGAGARSVALYAGRLHPQKGIDALLDAATRLFEQRDDLMLLMVGEADSLAFARHVRDRIERSEQLSQRIRMLGKVSRPQLSILYQIADLALVPSIYEPFGYAAVEAMAAGVPTIASSVGGLAEIIEDRRSGLLIPVREDAEGPHVVDVSILCESCSLLLDNPSMASSLGKAARERILNDFAPRSMVRATEAIYKRVLTDASLRVQVSAAPSGSIPITTSRKAGHETENDPCNYGGVRNVE